MDRTEAQEIIDIIAGAVSTRDISASKVEMWVTQLLPLDRDLAVDAVRHGIRTWHYFPSWSEFYNGYQGQRRSRAVEIGQAENEQLLAPRNKAPEWVYVWLWCRNSRQPRQLRPFPQQRDWASPESLLSDEEYRELRDEWEQAGSPKIFSGSAAMFQPADDAA